MTRCDRCGDILEATNHRNIDNSDRRTVETQTCINCGWTKEVRL